MPAFLTLTLRRIAFCAFIIFLRCRLRAVLLLYGRSRVYARTVCRMRFHRMPRSLRRIARSALNLFLRTFERTCRFFIILPVPFRLGGSYYARWTLRGWRAARAGARTAPLPAPRYLSSRCSVAAYNGAGALLRLFSARVVCCALRLLRRVAFIL